MKYGTVAFVVRYSNQGSCTTGGLVPRMHGSTSGSRGGKSRRDEVRKNLTKSEAADWKRNCICSAYYTYGHWAGELPSDDSLLWTVRAADYLRSAAEYARPADGGDTKPASKQLQSSWPSFIPIRKFLCAPCMIDRPDWRGVTY